MTDLPQLNVLSEHACFGGLQRFYQHESQAIGLPMRFSVYLPPDAEGRKLPVLFYLAGLTCTEETFMIKAGAQRVAAELGVILVAPDTSPRGAGVPGEADSWDFGVGAGFYLDATAGWRLPLLALAAGLVIWRTRLHLLWVLAAGALLGAFGLV